MYENKSMVQGQRNSEAIFKRQGRFWVLDSQSLVDDLIIYG